MRSEQSLERIDNGPAGDIPAPVAAHPVGDRPKSDLRHHEHAVLVELARQADIAHACRLERETAAHFVSPKTVASRSTKAPVSMSEKRIAAGRPTCANASGGKVSPPTVHQKDWEAKARR